MLKRRIIPIELLNDHRLVKTIGFSSPRDVGDPLKSSQVYSDQDADELVLLNISRKERNALPLIQILSEISKQCFVPLTVGGGIRSLEEASSLFKAGADKIVLNSIVYENPNLISEIGNRFGQQSVVVSIDVRLNKNCYTLYSDCGQKKEPTKLINHLKRVINIGAAEILIQSIDNDGKMSGYDLKLIDTVIKNSTVPVIVAGGAGDFFHLKKALDQGADAVACGSLFNFGDNNPLRAKAFLKNYNIPLKNI